MIRVDKSQLVAVLKSLISILNLKKSKKDSKNQESIQSSTTPVPGYQMGK